MAKQVKWYADIQGDGQLGPTIVCGPCCEMNIPKDEFAAMSEVKDPDPIKTCHYCFRPAGRPPPIERKNEPKVRLRKKPSSFNPEWLKRV